MDDPDITDVVHYKTYPRFERLPVGGDTLHRILLHAAGRNEGDLRAYPSAGARFPIEIYFLAMSVESVEPGIYHFSPLNNSIEILWLGDFSEKLQSTLGSEVNGFLSMARAVFIMTSIDGRTTVKYGEEGSDFPLIEAGFIGANITLLCEEQGLNSVPIGTQWWKDEIAEMIDYDGDNERVVSAIAIM